MLYKDGCIWRGQHWRLRKVKKVVDALWLEHGQEAVMTSGLDGEHSEWSWHTHGCASDFRIKYFAPSLHAEIAAELRRRLGPPYQVILHPMSHIHVEFDPVVFRLDTV